MAGVIGISTPRAATYAAIGAAVIAGAAIALSSGGGSDYTVSATVSDASYIIDGSPVRLAGHVVGAVSAVRATEAGTAVVTLQISDAQYAPLPRGTRLALRWMSTIAYAGRYVELDLPTSAASGAGVSGAIAPGGTIPTGDTQVPVEFDQLFGTFDGPVRQSLRATLTTSGVALQASAPAIAASVTRAPSALSQARAVLTDVGADEGSLDTLVRASSQVAGAVNAADPGLGQLVSGGGRTFAAVATRADALQSTLSELPAALDSTRTTLAHAQRTLSAVNTLARRIAPGIVEVQRIAQPLNDTLVTLRDVGPGAESTLISLRQATPSLNPLLSAATRLMPTLDRTARQATTEVACIRPYAPELAGFASNWTGFLAYGDSHDKYARANFPVLPYPNATPLTSSDVAKTFPTLQYHYPYPPGETSGQPWFIPACGMGPDTLNPADDPEAAK